MKRPVRFLLKAFLYLILTLFILLLVLPLFFKNQIVIRAEKELNDRLKARVELDDLGLSFFTSFPNLTVNLKGLRIIGTDIFDKDTLLDLPSFRLAINPFSLLGKEGPEVTSLYILQPEIRLKILESGETNYDIFETFEAEEPNGQDTLDQASAVTLNLRKFTIQDAHIHYHDQSSGMKVILDRFQLFLSGRLGLSKTVINLDAESESLTFELGGTRYLNGVDLAFIAGIDADLDQMKYSFLNNRLRMNALAIEFSGDLDLSGDHPQVDMRFRSADNDFKSLISLIPAIYRKDFETLQADGTLGLEGEMQGMYASADSLYPDFDLRVEVKNAMFKYPDLPAAVDDVNFLMQIQKKGRDLDNTIMDLHRFSMKMANQPLEASLLLHHPISDPTIRAWCKTNADLAFLEKAVPMDSTVLRGTMEAELNLDGQLSSIEMGHYEHFEATGYAALEGFEWSRPDADFPVRISQARLDVNPAFLGLSGMEMFLGESDFRIEGQLQNYLAYLLKDATIKGELSMRSTLCDLNALLPSGEDTAEDEPSNDSLTLVQIPQNIDFRFGSSLKEVRFSNMVLQDVNGIVLVREGKLILEGLDMNVLNGKLYASGTYDTSDTLKSTVTMMLSVESMDIPAAFNTFNVVQSLAPFARDLRGKVSASLNYSSLIGSDLKPVVPSMYGSGTLRSEEVQILSSKAFDQFKTLFKVDNQLTNTFKDLNLSFGMANGRLIVDPFDVRFAGTTVNVSGDHGLDQTLNYLLKTTIPREALGSGVNQLADKVLTQATSLGLDLDPGNEIPVNIKVTGKIGNPQLTPAIGSRASVSMKDAAVDEIKEAIEDKTNQLKEEIRQDVSEEVSRIMEQAEKEAENIRKLAAESAETIKKEGYAAAERVENEARGKGMIAENIARSAADKLRQEADRQAQNVIREADEKAILILEEAREKARMLEEGKK